MPGNTCGFRPNYYTIDLQLSRRFFDSKTTVSTWPEYIEQFSGNFKWVDWVGSNSALFEHVYDVLFYIVALFSC